MRRQRAGDADRELAHRVLTTSVGGRRRCVRLGVVLVAEEVADVDRGPPARREPDAGGDLVVALAEVVGCGRPPRRALGSELVAQREVGRSPVHRLAQARRIGRTVAHVLERGAQVRHLRMLVHELGQSPVALGQRDEGRDEGRPGIAVVAQGIVLIARLETRPDRRRQRVARAAAHAVRTQVEVLQLEVQRLIEVVFEACLPASAVDEIVASSRSEGDRAVRRIGGTPGEGLAARRQADVRIVLQSARCIQRPGLSALRAAFQRQLLDAAHRPGHDQHHHDEYHRPWQARAHREGASTWLATAPAPGPPSPGAPRVPGTSRVRARRPRSRRRNPMSRCTAPVRSARCTVPTRRRSPVRSTGTRAPPAPSAARASAMVALIASAVPWSRMLPGGALRIVSSRASRSASSASTAGIVLNSHAGRGGQSFAAVPAKPPNETGMSPTTTEPTVAPEGSRTDSTPALPLMTRTRPVPVGSTATPSGPDAVRRTPATSFSVVSIDTTVVWAELLTHALPRSASTATPKGFRPTPMVVSKVRLTRPMTVTEPAPKLET